jgi:hypothetical protein
MAGLSAVVVITRMMNLRPLLAFAVCGSAFAGAPADVTNFIYYEAGRNFHSAYSFALVLQADHTAHGLFETSTGAGTFNDATLPTQDLRWKYVRIDDQTAVLTISLDVEHPASSFEVHTLQFIGDDRGTRNVLTVSGSFYLALESTRPPLANCSNRSFVTGGHTAFTGFVVTGDRPRAVLVRAAGPALAAFGISDALANPTLILRRHVATTWQNDDWEQTGAESIRQTSTYAGAFPFAAGSKDAALVAYLGPGDYTAEVSSAVIGDSGQVLIEVYILP